MCFPDSQADMYLDIITTCAKEDAEEGVEEEDTAALKKGQRRRMVPSEFIVQSRISPLIDTHKGGLPLHQIYPNQPHSSHLAFGYAEMKSVEPSSNTHSLLNSQHVISEWHVLLLYSVSSTTTRAIRRDFCCVITHPRYNLLIINRSY